MNLSNSVFLCLDIGNSNIRGIACHILNGRINKTKTYQEPNVNTIYTIKRVVDELEQQIGHHLDSAYITGDFSESEFIISQQQTKWLSDHLITKTDIASQIKLLNVKNDLYPMHIIPLKYILDETHTVSSPIGFTSNNLKSFFASIYYNIHNIDKISCSIRKAHIIQNRCYDPQFLHNAILHTTSDTCMFIDFGTFFTSVSIWTQFGPIFHKKIHFGGFNITEQLVNKFHLTFSEADRLKRSVASVFTTEQDLYTPADINYEYLRSDINDIYSPAITNLIKTIQQETATIFTKRQPNQIILTGGGAEAIGIEVLINKIFNITVKKYDANQTILSLFKYIWNTEQKHCKQYLAKQEKFYNTYNKITKLFRPTKKQTKQTIPILPSSICFNMMDVNTYKIFDSANISAIHVDVMDGFFVERIENNNDELSFIRKHSTNHLHVHLMTQNPIFWTSKVLSAGADTIVLSLETPGINTAIQQIRTAKKRVGIAISPNTNITEITKYLKKIDEVMVMAVQPGASGQKFNPDTLSKISILNTTRKKHNLKFIISVDGGINELTAKQCWKFGADILISGSYLAHSEDFALAVQKLLK